MPSRRTSLIAFATICSLMSVKSSADDGIGSFDGAVWRFTMDPVGRGQKMGGVFRVKNNALFQKENPEDKEFKRSIGTNHPKDKHNTRMVFTGLMTGAPKKGVVEENLKGAAALKMEEAGKWSGRFIAEDGRHYRFYCTRIQE